MKIRMTTTQPLRMGGLGGGEPDTIEGEPDYVETAVAENLADDYHYQGIASLEPGETYTITFEAIA